jgi:hypothetical protein
MFLPDLPGEKYVFDISDIAPVEGVFRVQNESELRFLFLHSTRACLRICSVFPYSAKQSCVVP